jgi:hypothetical protein
MSQTVLPKNSDAKASRTGGGSSPEQGVRIDRRRFLAAAAAAVGASAVEGIPAVAHGNALSADALRSLPRDRISIQLFTLRDLLAFDLQRTLNALRAIGYRRVEHAGFVDRSVQDFKAALDAAGLVASSGHVAIPQRSTPRCGTRRCRTRSPWGRGTSSTRSSGSIFSRTGGSCATAPPGARSPAT